MEKINPSIPSTPTSTKFILTYSLKESFRRKCYFFLCLFACFLVCLVALISKTVLNQGPIIFLMLAEHNVGERDIVLKTNFMRKPSMSQEDIGDARYYYAFINYTKFADEFEEKNFDIRGQSSPRINFVASSGKCLGCETALVDLNIIDNDKESKMELGRAYPYKKLSPGECLIHETIAERMKISSTQINETIYIIANSEALLKNILIQTYYDNTTHPYNENINNISNIDFALKYPCKLVGIMESTYGKSGESDAKLLIMEQDGFFKYISDYLPPYTLSLFPDFKDIFSQLNIQDYASQITVNFPEPRINTYLVSNIDDLQYSGVSFGNKIIRTMGENARNFLILSMPVIDQMKPLFYGSIFLGLILNVIITILFVLNLILIHSLLVITTETNSFEFGILRLIGTSKKGIILISVFQCLSFSIPACLLAYGVHFYVLDFISLILAKYTNTTSHFGQSLSSITFSIIICNLAPLLAAIYPIRNLLKKNLAHALNTNLNKSSGVNIEIISAAQRERQTIIVFGILTFLYGASIYYFLPLSLLSINLNLLLFIFLWILIGILLGFIILSLNIENLLQKFFTHLFLFFSSSYTKLMILKNLATHRIRNRQTSMMYSLSVGFFIMITVGLDIELKSLTLQKLLKVGAYVELDNVAGFSISPHSIYNSIQKMKEEKLIEDYTFISVELSFMCLSSSTRIMNIGKSMDFSTDFIGIPPNFFEVADKVFLKIDEQPYLQDTGRKGVNDLSLAEKLYLPDNDSRAGISGIITWEIDTHINDLFYLIIQKDANIMPLVFKPAFILHSAPALKMSAEPSTMYQRASLLPVHTYIDMVRKCWNFFITEREAIPAVSFDNFPIKKVLLKLNPDMDTDFAMKRIKTIVWEDPSYYVRTWFYRDFEENIDKIKGICDLIFSGVSIIILIFCFFNLSASMSINIFEQRKEIAILRSLGIPSNKILLIYICEGSILIFTSSFIGLFIGSLISWTMTLQRVIFTNLPLHFNFPYFQLLFLLFASFLGGFLSTVFPARNLLSKSISNLIRK